MGSVIGYHTGSLLSKAGIRMKYLQITEKQNTFKNENFHIGSSGVFILTVEGGGQGSLNNETQHLQIPDSTYSGTRKSLLYVHFSEHRYLA